MGVATYLARPFAAAYGISVEEFYSEFEELMTKRRGSARRRPASNQVSLGHNRGLGRYASSGDTSTSHEIQNGARAAFGSAQAKSDDDGEFKSARRPEERGSPDRGPVVGRPALGASIGGHREAMVRRCQKRTPADRSGTSDPPPLTITVDADKCRWRIRGTLTGPDDKPLAGIEIRARGDHDEVRSQVREVRRHFRRVATSSGSYQLSVETGWMSKLNGTTR